MASVGAQTTLGSASALRTALTRLAPSALREATPGQILISPRVLTKVENAVKVEPVGEFAFKGIRRPLAAYNVSPLHRLECESRRYGNGMEP